MTIVGAPIDKHVGDDAPFFFDFSAIVCDGHTLHGISQITVEPSGLVLGASQVVANTMVEVWLSGGDAFVDYFVTVAVTTTRVVGEKREALARTFLVRVGE